MSTKMAALRRRQLDAFFTKLKGNNLAKPKKGWVREIREALGMRMSDLADRLETIKQRVERIEKDELSGKVTMRTMQKTAEAMDCEFVYFFVPRGSLQKAIEKQAEKKAQEIAKMVNKTMDLEDQSTSGYMRKLSIAEIHQRLILSKKLWGKF